MTDKKKAEIEDAIKQLMTPERQEELTKFFASVPPVFQQFFLRFLDVRDSVIINFIQDDEVLAGKIADKVYGHFGQTFETYSLALEKIGKGQELILARLERAELAVKEEKKRIATLELRADDKKKRIEQLERQMRFLQEDNIENVAKEIQKITPLLLWFKKAFKWWKVVLYVLAITGLWLLLHFLFLT